MEKALKGVLVDVLSGTIEAKTIKDSLESLYDVLNCDIIDVTTRSIGGCEYDIICDDNGLLREELFISAIDRFSRPCLVGNLFIVKGADENGEFIGLDDEDVKQIMKYSQELHYYKDNAYDAIYSTKKVVCLDDDLL